MLLALQQDIFELPALGIEPATARAVNLLLWAGLALALSTLLIAAIDVPYQIYEHTEKLKMTKQEVKDEMKNAEGSPETKGRIRQLQREMANNRMMSNVPEADVVITNPTHYSVALRYDPETMNTPILLAKGGDHVALKIREIAKAHKVEIIASPVLARAVFHTTEVDKEIPAGLYMAVAQVLAYVFQLRNYQKGRGERPEYPRKIHVPPDMRHD